MTAYKTASAIPEGSLDPGSPSGSAVAKGHDGAGTQRRSARDGARYFGQVLKLYGDYSHVTLRRLEWEWDSGQWFLLLKEDGDVLGWISWYRCDFRTLAIIRERDLPSLQLFGPASELFTRGEYLYIPTVVSAMPLKQYLGGPHVLFALLSMVRHLNTDARVIAWHSRGRGKRFRVFPFHKLVGVNDGH